MRLTVFGATGGVGREVVAQALDRGDQVTAYVRNPAKLDLTHPELTVIAGELTDTEAVRRAVSGADAVISALGPSLDRKATGMPLIDGTRTIVEAMQAEGVARYIGMATPSLRDPHDTRSLPGLVVPFMGRTFLKRAYRELLDMSQLVTGSSPRERRTGVAGRTPRRSSAGGTGPGRPDRTPSRRTGRHPPRARREHALLNQRPRAAAGPTTILAVTAKEQLLERVRGLSEAEAAEALRLLDARQDPLSRRLDDAPLEDEEISPEEEAAVQEARDELASGAALISHEEIKREFGSG